MITSNNLRNKIGNNIRLIRKQKGLSQKTLADKSGVNAKELSCIELGQRNLTIDTLEKIAAGLDTHVQIYIGK